MGLFDKAIGKIDDGINGNNKGLPHGFHRMIDFVPNIQKGTYFLVGGETGSGKTSFTDDTFLYKPFDYVHDPILFARSFYGLKAGDTKGEALVLEEHERANIKVKFIYYSFEIEKTIKIIKGVCRRLYYKYGIITDVNYVLSRGKYRVSQEIYDLVKETREYFEKLEDMLDIHDIPMNPTGINKYLANYFSKNGKIVKSGEGKAEYIPNDPNLYVIGVFDHAALSKKEQGFTTKENIDKLSEYCVFHRNMHDFIPVVISQFNRSLSSTDRFKLEMVRPQLSDFKDSGNTQQDANTVFGLFSPNRYSIREYGGYKVGLLEDRFRGLSILKTRDGTPDVNVPLGYVGEIGVFRELPPSKKLEEDDNKGYNNLIDQISTKIHPDLRKEKVS